LTENQALQIGRENLFRSLVNSSRNAVQRNGKCSWMINTYRCVALLFESC